MVAKDEDKINYMLRKLTEEYKQWGLLFLCRWENDIFSFWPRRIRGVDSYTYLGVMFDKKVTNEAGKKRISQGSNQLGNCTLYVGTKGSSIDQDVNCTDALIMRQKQYHCAAKVYWQYLYLVNSSNIWANFNSL